ncbi:MAG: hypothetical protein JW971_06135 [Synergistales bacterium]|nr:hypothetical protein [Synergistales bacterium]
MTPLCTKSVEEEHVSGCNYEPMLFPIEIAKKITQPCIDNYGHDPLARAEFSAPLDSGPYIGP